MNAAVRQAARAGARALHSTPAARGGAVPEGFDYLHAKHMYNLRNKPAGKLKCGALIFGGVALGVGIPIFAVQFNQKKAGLI